jgi:hypothetical protein
VTFRLLADAVVVLHLAFVLFAVFGGLLVLRRRAVAWVHVPAVAWGAWIEFAGWICPLTPLENRLREQGGGTAYTSSFVERYIIPTLYPEALSREWQWTLGGLLIILNVLVYSAVVRQGQVRSAHSHAARGHE